ncbi:dTDP-4-amino-4,6-dideoxygalactose transaminase [Patescibacteria group bacterium]|nr:dTDP-4-amino-4,6-dideoxygalactose transaminase [Patescibacteria group bacterium]MBU1472910.1 dTDP-4-amino-4,6-dideoxygalactose transaminase [Patescibacteria group bacterium]MBU2460320.1 dTDP-4-amino-4,6-dideoxygalactose transaminase [Patescibacteria group bacterium]
MNIPLNKPYWGKREEEAVIRAMRTGTGVGDGGNTRVATEKLKTLIGSRYCYLVTSCTSAMDIALLALGLKPEEEVIVPSFTLSATATPVLLAGGRPVFADIDPVTYCIDPLDIEKVITKRTRGIMVVHYAGMAAPMEKILALAKAYKLWVVEDAAHAIGAYYHRGPAFGAHQGRASHLGTFGIAGAFSFHGTKNVCCGEGGAIVTDDPELSGKIDVLRAVGTNRSAFLAGKVSLYEWVGEGSSYLLSDILASILINQIDRIDRINKKRGQIASFYNKIFQPYSHVIRLPSVPEGAVPNWHIYALKFKTESRRKNFQTKMRQKGIEVSTHYVPLHSSPMGRKLGGDRRKLTVTEDVARTLVRMPIYPGLTEKEQEYVAREAKKILD